MCISSFPIYTLAEPPRGAKLWADGKGLSKAEKARIAAGEDWEEVLGSPSIIVGVEADVGEREDWHDWWARPVSSSRMITGLLFIAERNR